MAYVYVGIGSNCEREKHVRAAICALQSRFGKIIISSVYESKAVGFEGAAFYNLVVGFETTLSVGDLSTLLKRIEDDNDRVRGMPHAFADRTLDIDILLYDDYVGVFDNVTLPRSEILKNAFVLWPLAEIAPTFVHPEAQKTIGQLWEAFDKNRQELHKIDFNFEGDQ
jgi:2-amino-4-hydroxy-6-hydroxymethyldihydropteridine diphosphokinase